MALYLLNSICELYKTFPCIPNWIKVFQDYINQLICTVQILNFSFILRTRISHTTCISIYSQWGPDSIRKPFLTWILSKSTFENISVFYWLANQRSLLIWISENDANQAFISWHQVKKWVTSICHNPYWGCIFGNCWWRISSLKMKRLINW